MSEATTFKVGDFVTHYESGAIGKVKDISSAEPSGSYRVYVIWDGRGYPVRQWDFELMAVPAPENWNDIANAPLPPEQRTDVPPATPSDTMAGSLRDRIAALETTVAKLVKRVKALEMDQDMIGDDGISYCPNCEKSRTVKFNGRFWICQTCAFAVPGDQGIDDLPLSNADDPAGLPTRDDIPAGLAPFSVGDKVRVKVGYGEYIREVTGHESDYRDGQILTIGNNHLAHHDGFHSYMMADGPHAMSERWIEAATDTQLSAPLVVAATERAVDADTLSWGKRANEALAEPSHRTASMMTPDEVRAKQDALIAVDTQTALNRAEYEQAVQAANEAADATANVATAKLTKAQRDALEHIANPDRSTYKNWLNGNGRFNTYRALLVRGLIRDRIVDDPLWKEILITDLGRQALKGDNL